MTYQVVIAPVDTSRAQPEGSETRRFVKGLIIGGAISLLLWAPFLALIFLG